MAANEESCLLKISNSEHFNKFLHECVDDLIDKKHDAFTDYSSDIEWTKAELQRARNLIQNLYKQSVMQDAFPTEFFNLNANTVEDIRLCYEIRKSEILQACVRDKYLKNGQDLVENIDWKIKWVIGSSKLASISEPLLQLDLHCQKESGSSGGRKSLNCEMNLEQLDKLILELENVKEAL